MNKDIFENFSDLIWSLSGEGDFIFVNSVVKTILGYTPAEFLKLKLKDLTTSEPDDLKKILPVLQGSSPQKRTELVLKTKNNEIRHFDIAVYPENKLDIDIPGTVSIARDITALKQAEKELAESELLYRNLADVSLTGIFVHRMGKLLYVNQRLLEMSGYPGEKEFLAKSVLDHVCPEDKQKVIERMQSRMAGVEVPPEYEVRILQFNGNTRWIRLNAAMIDYEEEPAILCNVIDITELLQLKQQKILSERLETAGRIVGRIAHEVSNFLSPILGYSELLLMKNEFPEDSPTQGYLQSMKICSERLAEVNNDILALGRRLHFNVEPLSINAVINEVIEEIEYSYEVKPEFKRDLDESCPQIQGDIRQLQRVIANILNNSFEGMGGKGLISIATSHVIMAKAYKGYDTIEPGEYIRITVTDTGTGIPEDIRDKIFEPFFSTKSREERRGSGLGLSVVRAVVKDHEGAIDIKSEEGRGTAFSIYFPAMREA